MDKAVVTQIFSRACNGETISIPGTGQWTLILQADIVIDLKLLGYSLTNSDYHP